jgi:hypothetical protein
MEKDNNYPQITNIELYYDEFEDINEALESDDIKDFLLKKSYENIKKAIEQNLDKIELFNILNLALVVEIDKNQFKPILKNTLLYYESMEDYKKCSQIKSLIEKL